MVVQRRSVVDRKLHRHWPVMRPPCLVLAGTPCTTYVALEFHSVCGLYFEPDVCSSLSRAKTHSEAITPNDKRENNYAAMPLIRPRVIRDS